MKHYDRFILEMDGDPLSMYIFGMIGLKDNRITVVPKGSPILEKELSPSSILIRCELVDWEGGEDDLRPDYEVISGIGKHATPDNLMLYFRLGTYEDGLYYNGEIPDVPDAGYSYPAYVVRFWKDDFLDKSGEMDIAGIQKFQKEVGRDLLFYLDEEQDMFDYMVDNMPLIMKYKNEILSRPGLYGIPLGIPRAMFFDNEISRLGEFLIMCSVPGFGLDGFMGGEIYKGWPLYIDSSSVDYSQNRIVCDPMHVVIWCPEIKRTLTVFIEKGFSRWIRKFNRYCDERTGQFRSMMTGDKVWSMGRLIATLKDLEAGKEANLPYPSQSLMHAVIQNN